MNLHDKKYHSIQITRRFLGVMDYILSNRDNGKVTAKQFSEVAGMTSSNINRLRSCTGENIVTVEAIGRVCEYYHVSAYWLITGKGDIYNNDELCAANKTLEASLNDVVTAIIDIKKSYELISKHKTKDGQKCQNRVKLVSKKNAIKKMRPKDN